MTSDAQAFALLVFSCAVGVTAHVAIAWRLVAVASRWRALLALLALLVPPLALFLGLRARMFATSAIWLLAWIAYFAIRARA